MQTGSSNVIALGVKPLPRHFDDADDVAARQAEANRAARAAIYRDELRRALLNDPETTVATPADAQRYTPATAILEDMSAESGSTVMRDLLRIAAAAIADPASAKTQAELLFSRVAAVHGQRQAGRGRDGRDDV